MLAFLAPVVAYLGLRVAIELELDGASYSTSYVWTVAILTVVGYLTALWRSSNHKH